MLLIITISNAQITDGNWMVGGNGSFSSKENYNNNNKSDKGQVNELDISANLGLFFYRQSCNRHKNRIQELYNSKFRWQWR